MVVKEEAAVLVVRRHRRAVGAAVRRDVDDEVPGAVEEEAGPAAVRRVPPGLLGALPELCYAARCVSASLLYPRLCACSCLLILLVVLLLVLFTLLHNRTRCLCCRGGYGVEHATDDVYLRVVLVGAPLVLRGVL